VRVHAGPIPIPWKLLWRQSLLLAVQQRPGPPRSRASWGSGRSTLPLKSQVGRKCACLIVTAHRWQPPLPACLLGFCTFPMSSCHCGRQGRGACRSSCLMHASRTRTHIVIFYDASLTCARRRARGHAEAKVEGAARCGRQRSDEPASAGGHLQGRGRPPQPPPKFVAGGAPHSFFNPFSPRL